MSNNSHNFQRLRKSLEEAREQLTTALAERERVEAELAKLKSEVADHSDFMAFMAAELAQFECLCGKEHGETMPMMWPELIQCIVAKAIKDSKREASNVEISGSSTGQGNE